MGIQRPSYSTPYIRVCLAGRTAAMFNAATNPTDFDKIAIFRFFFAFFLIFLLIFSEIQKSFIYPLL